MSAIKEAFIRSFKHKMDFDISTPHGFLAFMNKNRGFVRISRSWVPLINEYQKIVGALKLDLEKS